MWFSVCVVKFMINVVINFIIPLLIHHVVHTLYMYAVESGKQMLEY